jgi:IS5 family transposase
MLRDRYDPQDLFTHLPARSVRMEDTLAQLDPLLEDDALFTAVRQDLARRHPHTLTRGRRSTPVEVILRLLVVMRLYGWSFAQTEYFVADSLTLRQFCRVYWEPVPDDTTLLRWARLIGPETLERLNARVVALAVEHQLTRGRKLRIDTTVVETNIHAPADSSLLTDGVRVLSRWLQRAKAVLQAHAGAPAWPPEVFRNRTRSMRQRSKALRNVIRRQERKAGAATAATTATTATTAGDAGEATETRNEAMQRIYRGLLSVARKSQAQAARARAALAELARAGHQEAGRVAEQLADWSGRLEQAVQQTRRRLLDGEAVPAAEKVFSLFEEHTQIFQRGKAGKRVEFGRKLVVAEVEGGIVSGYAVLASPQADQSVLPGSLEGHQARFGRAPALLTADRGLYSGPNEQLATQAGVKRVAIPYAGPAAKAPPERRQQERQPWFREGYRWRAGIEGRISLLQRRFQLKRCLYHGETGMQCWGAGESWPTTFGRWAGS